MVNLALQIRAELTNVTDLKPKDEDFLWNFKMKCSSCQEVTESFVTVSAKDEVAMHGSRGTSNYVGKCKFCKREGSASIISGPKEYKIENNMKFQQILTLDCRGIEPVEFSPKGEWIASGVDSVTKFNEIDFSMGDWADYDENADVEVSIMDFESSFVKLK